MKRNITIIAFIGLIAVTYYFLGNQLIDIYFGKQLYKHMYILTIIYYVGIVIIDVVFSYIEKEPVVLERKDLKIAYILILVISLFGKEINDPTAQTVNIGFESIKMMFQSIPSFIMGLANIVVIIPLGFMYKWSKKDIIKVAGAFLIVEILQYVFRVGIFDIIDVVFNLTGFLIGYMLRKKFIKEGKK